MARISVLVIAVGIAAGSFLLGMASHAEPPKAAPAETDFAGKVLVISSRSHPEMGTILEGSRVRHLGGQAFLVGKGLDSGQPGNWQRGQTVWVAVGDIAQLVEFASLEEFKKAAATVKRHPRPMP